MNDGGEATSGVGWARRKNGKCQEGPVTGTLLWKVGSWSLRLTFQNSASSDGGQAASGPFMGPRLRLLFLMDRAPWGRGQPLGPLSRKLAR